MIAPRPAGNKAAVRKGENRVSEAHNNYKAMQVIASPAGRWEKQGKQDTGALPLPTNHQDSRLPHRRRRRHRGRK